MSRPGRFALAPELAAEASIIGALPQAAVLREADGAIAACGVAVRAAQDGGLAVGLPGVAAMQSRRLGLTE